MSATRFEVRCTDPRRPGLVMATDVLFLNSAVLDLRGTDFDFVRGWAAAGGLARCPEAAIAGIRPDRIADWIGRGGATAGGPGNAAPLVARAGLKVAVAAYVGAGDQDGFDMAGRTFAGILSREGVDVSELKAHPRLPTALTFILEAVGEERGGIAYFPNANDDFDFQVFGQSVRRLRPRVLHYLYAGLSARGDANGGRDLAAFMHQCRREGVLTMTDSHTLAGDPSESIASGEPIPAYGVLEPVLPEVDLFFTSSHDARLMAPTLTPESATATPEAFPARFIEQVGRRFWTGPPRSRLFGVTVSDGAWFNGQRPDGSVIGPSRVLSRFLAGEVVDLVGAGDAFRAGLLSWVARHAAEFRQGTSNPEEAIQTGNLFASLFIHAPLIDRYAGIARLDRMVEVVREGRSWKSLDSLRHRLEDPEPGGGPMES